MSESLFFFCGILCANRKVTHIDFGAVWTWVFRSSLFFPWVHWLFSPEDGAKTTQVNVNRRCVVVGVDTSVPRSFQCPMFEFFVAVRKAQMSLC